MASHVVPPHNWRMVKLKQSEGEGRGVFAIQRIPAGTLVLHEHPIMVLAKTLHPFTNLTEEEVKENLTSTAEILRDLTDAERSDIRNLSRPGKRSFDLLKKNFRHSVDEKTIDNELLNLIIIVDYNAWGHDVYARVNRFNHSCVPNVLLSDIGHQILAYGMRDIEKGEELLFSYEPGMELTRLRAERNSLLESKYNFLCTCEACDGGKVEYHETIRREFAELRDNVQSFIRRGPALPDFAGDEDAALLVLADCKRLVQLCTKANDFGMPHLVDAYRCLANLYRRANNSKAASDAAGQAYFHARIIHGPESPYALVHLLAAGQLENLTMMKVAGLDYDEDWKGLRTDGPTWMERYWKPSAPDQDAVAEDDTNIDGHNDDETIQVDDTEEHAAAEA